MSETKTVPKRNVKQLSKKLKNFNKFTGNCYKLLRNLLDNYSSLNF